MTGTVAPPRQIAMLALAVLVPPAAMGAPAMATAAAAVRDPAIRAASDALLKRWQALPQAALPAARAAQLRARRAGFLKRVRE